MITGVRPLEAKDAPELAALLREMAAGYGAALAPDLDVAGDVLRQARHVGFLLAEDAGRLTGFATFTTTYPVAGLLAFLHVQQIYVALSARRLGVATRLMAGVSRIAVGRGITRVEWSTAAGNRAARALYDGMGATGMDKVHYVLSGEALISSATDP